jgi:hypothetical protein
MQCMKSWILGTLASLLTLSLCGAIISTTLNQTVVNAQYLENNFTAINGYNRLSTTLTNEVITQSGLSDTPQISSVVGEIVSPSAVKQRVNAAFEGLQNYLQGKGSTPTINLSGLASQAQSVGVPIEQSSSLLKTVTLGPTSNGSSRVSLNLDAYSRVTTVISVVLGIVVILLSLLWRRYTVVPGVLISTGVIMLVIAAVVHLVLGDLNHYFTFSGGSDSYAALGRDLAQEIGKDLVRRFGIIAVVCLVVGIGSRILIAVLRRRTTTSQQVITRQAVTTNQPRI